MLNKALLYCVLSLITAPVLAADIALGKVKSESCIGCHGVSGISNIDSYPNLAGQKEKYLAKQLKDYRSGRRRDQIMSSMAKMLQDKDIENIAAYYASLKAGK